MAQTVHRLMDFLDSHDYPHKQLAAENLMNGPSNKDFQLVFEFLIQCIDRDFKLHVESKDGKVETLGDQIPPLFKQLGYPYVLSKSILQSAGAPTTWPQLLGALNWLRELIEFEEVCIYLSIVCFVIACFAFICFISCLVSQS
jgi:kinetochore protein NDC80